MELAKNKKAFFDYEILKEFEAGLILHGYEVKAIRQKKCNLKGSYVTFLNEEAWVDKMLISPYQAANQPEDSGSRKRKLLLNRQEIDKLINQSETPGITIIPLKLFLKNNRIKMVIGVCRGKKTHDKRDVIKKRGLDRELKRHFKTR